MSEGVAVVACEGEYEANVLLEPSPTTPFDVILAALQPTPSTAPPSDNPKGPSGTADTEQPTTSGAAGLIDVAARLKEHGIDMDSFAAEQPRWRWRLTNIAIKAGSGSGHIMNYSQLHYLRAELDFRMLHARHAAMVCHHSF